MIYPSDNGLPQEGKRSALASSYRCHTADLETENGTSPRLPFAIYRPDQHFQGVRAFLPEAPHPRTST